MLLIEKLQIINPQTNEINIINWNTLKAKEILAEDKPLDLDNISNFIDENINDFRSTEIENYILEINSGNLIKKCNDFFLKLNNEKNKTEEFINSSKNLDTKKYNQRKLIKIEDKINRANEDFKIITSDDYKNEAEIAKSIIIDEEIKMLQKIGNKKGNNKFYDHYHSYSFGKSAIITLANSYIEQIKELNNELPADKKDNYIKVFKLAYLNAYINSFEETRLKKSLASKAQNHAKKVQAVTNIVDANTLTPDQFKEVKIWLLKNIDKFMFLIPKCDGKVKDKDSLTYEESQYLRKMTRHFDFDERRFFDDIKNPEINIDFRYRLTSEETDMTYNMWHVSGTVTFKDNINTISSPLVAGVIKDLLESSIAISKHNLAKALEKNEDHNDLLDDNEKRHIKSYEEIVGGKTVNNYYFCLIILKKFFDSDLQKFHDEQTEVNLENPLDLDFPEIENK